jgi:uncharacterized membrane protein YcaP (DUF421 family)
MGKWHFFPESGLDVLGTVLTIVFAYIGMILFIRVCGKRTLAKMNVFDFVSIVAIGSMLADTVLTPEVPLARGLIAIAVLLALQVGISRLACLSDRLEKIINGKPRLVLSHGKFLHENMKSERVTEEELRAAIRAHKLAHLEDVHAVILETDGSFSVIAEEEVKHAETSSLADVER